MKNFLITLILVVSSTTIALSQFTFDILVGVSPESNPVTADLFVNSKTPMQEFRFNMMQSDAQVFAGVKGNIKLKGSFFVDLGLLYGKQKSTYQALFTMEDEDLVSSIHLYKVADHLLLLPVNIGVNLGIVDVTSGFRVIQSIATKTTLHQLKGFSSDEHSTQLGWQTGAGISILKFHLGVEYQGNFSRVGKGMFVNGESLELKNMRGQFLFTIQQSL